MSSGDDDEALLAASAFIIVHLMKKKKRRPRRWWLTAPFLSRNVYSGSDLLKDLEQNDGGHFKTLCRMTPELFQTVLNLVAPKIEKQDTNYRKAIPAKERLALTLHFLATGNSYSSLAYMFKVSKQSISSIIPEVCNALIEVLHEYVQVRFIVYIISNYTYVIEYKF